MYLYEFEGPDWMHSSLGAFLLLATRHFGEACVECLRLRVQCVESLADCTVPPLYPVPAAGCRARCWSSRSNKSHVIILDHPQNISKT